MSGKLVLLAAGGTAGHLFPAFALSEELGRRGHTIDLITDERGDRYGTGFPAREVHQVPAATPSGRSPVAAAKAAITLSRGIAAAYSLIGRLAPAAVIGFGGYPTVPPLLAARMRRIPTAIHEQNAVLGRANRMLSKRVSAIALSFEETKLIEGTAVTRAHYTGNPVRTTVIDWAQRAYRAAGAAERFDLLVFGGSQGARYFSDAVPPALALLPAGTRARLVVTQQCRPEDIDRVRAAYAASGVTADLASFFKDLPERMAASQLVIARAGASTIAELAVMGRPSILVPLPHALDNDQLQNARQLAGLGGAWCIEQKDLTPDRLAAEISRLMGEPSLLPAAAAAARSAGRADAVLRLADLVEEIMQVRAPAKAARA
ncbi:MAG TPA: undecaprenyldiphospho-muramoylpentapeptide beta-N-acetylglucosaminyltransferase [Hyphomicrobiaceae bacterium]|nr:undecaprenyldiphospho-muramoylpentapeptide beta-N-acetylglucosaminyltransferase [Hyphomicrobiaceae bacterium]